MAKMTFVDAQFVVALVNQRDQNHERAVELSKEFAGQPLVTTDVVLIEIGNALARNYRPQSVEVIEYFHRAANIEIVHLTPTLFAEAFSLYKARMDKAWGITDCVSFVVMRRTGLQDALTCDRHFTQAGFAVLMGAEHL